MPPISVPGVMRVWIGFRGTGFLCLSSSFRVCGWSVGAPGAEAAHAAANCGELVAETTVRTLVVVFFLASSSKPLRLGQVGELLALQKLVPQPVEEGFREAVFPKAAWLDVEPSSDPPAGRDGESPWR